jgi:transposase
MNKHQIEFKASRLNKGVNVIHLWVYGNIIITKLKKMEYKAFIGIDISKETIDVAIRTKILKEPVHEKFENGKKGFNGLLSWVKKQTGITGKELFFCMEHTGVYALPLACFLTEKQLPFRLENPYHLKHSMGIQRGKNDKADAKMIARYAYMHHEELRLTELPGFALIRLQNLLAHRERLVKTRKMYNVAPKELSEFSGKDVHSFISEESKEVVELLEIKIKSAEREIEKLIAEDEGLKKNFVLARSVKGVGLVIAAYMLVYTQNFSSITDSRRFASYSGIAPFGEKSGTSIDKTPHVSHLANKRMKSLLNNGAWSAIKCDIELKAYFDRKRKEGKHELVIINAVRNKLVGRVFASIKRGTPYVELHQYCKN